MSDDILDVLMVDFSSAYHLWVDRPQECEDVIANWYREAHDGRDPSLNDLHHAYWRVTVEHERWGTLRHALQDTWPLDVSNGPVPQPAPGPLPAPIDPPIVPPQPAPAPSPSRPAGPGGLVLSASDTSVRPRLTRSQMESFLPDRGEFRFPSPWNTQGVRITNASDGIVRPIGMTYWPNINNHAGQEAMFVFLSINDTLTVFAVWKDSLLVRRLGPLPYRSTGENCYWSFTDPHLLYIMQGPRLLRYHVETEAEETVFTAPSDIWQPHSSADGRVHSFKLEGGAAVYRNGRFSRWSPEGSFDECQVDKSGEYLVSWEDGHNRIIHLASGEEFWIRRGAGAVGHHDMGYACLIGEDGNTSGVPAGAFRRYRLTPHGPEDGGIVYRDHDWGVERNGITRYVSFCDARPGDLRDQTVLYAVSDTTDSPRNNEFTAGRLDDSERICVVCPNLTRLEVGPQDRDSIYWRKPRPNLDPVGEWFIWTANAGGVRMDAYLGRVPAW